MGFRSFLLDIKQPTSFPSPKGTTLRTLPRTLPTPPEYSTLSASTSNTVLSQPWETYINGIKLCLILAASFSPKTHDVCKQIYIAMGRFLSLILTAMWSSMISHDYDKCCHHKVYVCCLCVYRRVLPRHTPRGYSLGHELGMPSCVTSQRPSAWLCLAPVPSTALHSLSFPTCTSEWPTCPCLPGGGREHLLLKEHASDDWCVLLLHGYWPWRVLSCGPCPYRPWAVHLFLTDSGILSGLWLRKDWVTVLHQATCAANIFNGYSFSFRLWCAFVTGKFYILIWLHLTIFSICAFYNFGNPSLHEYHKSIFLYLLKILNFYFSGSHLYSEEGVFLARVGWGFTALSHRDVNAAMCLASQGGSPRWGHLKGTRFLAKHLFSRFYMWFIHLVHVTVPEPKPHCFW